MQRALLFLLTICICIALTAPVLAAESVRLCREASSTGAYGDVIVEPPSVSATKTVNYEGTLRVFVVEPESRWLDYDGRKYGFAFLSFAIEQAISIPYQETVHFQATWNGSTYGFGNVTEDNIMVIAAVYEDDSHTAYSDPPSGYPYTAHYVDAAAAATSGHTGADTATANSTHTIFIEEGTATWCPSCPSARAALHTVYASGQYNFFYTAHVVDVNTYADNRMNDFNLHWLPSCYYDAGYRYNNGQSTSEVVTGITQAGARVVPDLDLEVSMTWLGSSSIQVDVSVTNNQYVNTMPLTPTTPAGPAVGAETKPYAFTTSATDADNDPLYYMYDWGDGTQSEWLGPYTSGAECSASHAWAVDSSFNVKAKAKDTLDAETGWSQIATIELGVAGDANGDANVTIGDAVFIITYVFRGGPAPTIFDCGDANCDGNINVGDAVFVVNFVFRSGPEPGCD